MAIWIEIRCFCIENFSLLFERRFELTKYFSYKKRLSCAIVELELLMAIRMCICVFVPLCNKSNRKAIDARRFAIEAPALRIISQLVVLPTDQSSFAQ